MEKIIKEGICYALLRTLDVDDINPIAHERHDLNWYPETRLTLLGQIDFRPTKLSVVTESPWIVSCYLRENVRVWENGEWVIPDDNTYGTSVEIIMDNIFHIDQSIPNSPLEVIKTLNEKLG